MPFNANGFFQRLFNWHNDRDAGIKILAERMDQEMDGIVDGINDIVAGEAPLRGPVKGVDGTAANPSYSFKDDPDTGIYHAADDVIGLSAGGEKKLEVSKTDIKFDGHKVHHAGNDGEGSGLDADLLDGQHANAFQQKAPQIIPGNADLNTYVKPGEYFQNQDADAISGSNYPDDRAGYLEVQTDNADGTAWVFQRYTVYITQNNDHKTTIYTRRRYGDWSDWVEHWTTDTDGNGTITGTLNFGNATSGVRKGPDGETILIGQKVFLQDGDNYHELLHRGNGDGQAPFQSRSDFADGTLVQTDLSGIKSFTVEIVGKSYHNSGPPLNILIEGYRYADGFLSFKANVISGDFDGPLMVFEDDSSKYLKFWWPRLGYWNSFSVRVTNANSEQDQAINHVTAITNAAQPTDSIKATAALTHTLNSHRRYGFSVNVSGGDTRTTGYTYIGKSGETSGLDLYTNQGGCFSSATGRFTAPVSGLYAFNLSGSPSTDTFSPIFKIYKNGGAASSAAYAYNARYNGASVQSVFALEAGDYVDGRMGHVNDVTSRLYSGTFSGHFIG